MWKNRSTSAAPFSSSTSSSNPSFAHTTTTSAAQDASKQEQDDRADLNSLIAESVSRRRSLVSSITSLGRSKKAKTVLRFAFDSAPIKESDHEREERDSSSMRSKSALTIGPSSSSAAPNSEALLTLLLSSTSFLDTTVTDEGKKLYVIDTRASRTSVCREEPVKGIVHCGAIHWVQENAVDRTLGIVQETTVHMAGGRKMSVRDFLKSTAFSTSTKQFSVPNFPYVLKWKRTSQLLTLTVAKGKEKTTVATLEPAILEAPPRIRIYDPLYEPDPTRPLKEHRGIPTLLLDYLIVSAIIMCADKHEWLQAAQQPAGVAPPKEERETQNLIQQWRHHVESVAEEENILVPSRARPGSSIGSSTSVVDVSLDSVYGHGRANNTLETPRVSDRRSFDLSSPSTNSHPSTIFTSFSGVAHPYAATFIDENSSPASEFGQSIYSGFQSDGRADDITPRGATHPINRSSSGHGRMASADARSEPDNASRSRYAGSIMSTAAMSTISSPAPGSSARRRPLPTIPTGGFGVPPVPNIPPELLARLNLGQQSAGFGMSEFGEQTTPRDFPHNNTLGISSPPSMSSQNSPVYGSASYVNSPASENAPNARPRMPTLGSSSELVPGASTRSGFAPTEAEPRRRTTSENATVLMSSPQWAADGPLQQPLGNRGSGTSTPTLPAGAVPGQQQQEGDRDEDQPVAGAAPSGSTRLQHRMSMYKGPRDGDAEVEQGGEPSVVHANAVDAGLVHGSMVQPLRLRSGDSSRARPSTAASSSSAYSSNTLGPLTAGSTSTFGGQLGRAAAVLEDDELDVDLDDEEIHDAEFAPPSYDSIDFSRPPVKPVQSLRIRQ